MGVVGHPWTWPAVYHWPAYHSRKSLRDTLVAKEWALCPPPTPAHHLIPAGSCDLPGILLPGIWNSDSSCYIGEPGHRPEHSKLAPLANPHPPAHPQLTPLLCSHSLQGRVTVASWRPGYLVPEVTPSVQVRGCWEDGAGQVQGGRKSLETPFSCLLPGSTSLAHLVLALVELAGMKEGLFLASKAWVQLSCLPPLPAAVPHPPPFRAAGIPWLQKRTLEGRP